MTDLRTALRRLNDAAHEALKAALERPLASCLPVGAITNLRIIVADTDRLVDETAPNVEGTQ